MLNYRREGEGNIEKNKNLVCVYPFTETNNDICMKFIADHQCPKTVSPRKLQA